MGIAKTKQELEGKGYKEMFWMNLLRAQQHGVGQDTQQESQNEIFSLHLETQGQMEVVLEIEYSNMVRSLHKKSTESDKKKVI